MHLTGDSTGDLTGDSTGDNTRDTSNVTIDKVEALEVLLKLAEDREIRRENARQRIIESR